MKPSELEQGILEAVRSDGEDVTLWRSDDVAALLAEKNAQIAKLKDDLGWFERAINIHNITLPGLLEWKNIAENCQRSRDEWKRIAGETRDTLHGCVDALAAVFVQSPLADAQVKNMLAKGAAVLEAYDALLKGEQDAG